MVLFSFIVNLNAYLVSFMALLGANLLTELAYSLIMAYDSS